MAFSLVNYLRKTYGIGVPPAYDDTTDLNAREAAIEKLSQDHDAETAPGRALVEAATASAQRTALGLGTAATKSVGTTAGTVAAGDDARLPTANEKTRLSDIQAATGATTALKLANLASPASTTQQGVALLGATGGAAKLTKMPDGATAVYSKTGYTDTTGYNNENTPSSILSVVNGNFRCAYSGSTVNRFYYSLAGNVLGGKTAVLLVRGSRNGIIINGYNGNSAYLVGSFTLSTNWQIVTFPLPAISGSWGLYQALANCVSGDYLEIGQVWIGDYSYLPGSLSEEAARIADQLGDTAGTPQAASGTIASNGTNVSNGNTVTIAGKVYTFRDAAYWAGTPVEGDVLIGATYIDSMVNLDRAIIRHLPGTYDGVIYKIAAAHPLVTAVLSASVITLTAISPGILGNQITIAKSASATTFTLSGSTLSGGKDAVGDKIHTQLQTMPASTEKYGAALLAADGGTTAGTAVQANDSRIPSAPAAWTPVINFGGAADDGTSTTTGNRYVTAGKKVHIEFQKKWTAKGTKTRAVTITGIPVAAPGTTMVVGMVFIPVGGSSIAGPIFVTISGSTIYLVMQGAAGYTELTAANFTNTTEIRFVADYIAA